MYDGKPKSSGVGSAIVCDGNRKSSGDRSATEGDEKVKSVRNFSTKADDNFEDESLLIKCHRFNLKKIKIKYYPCIYFTYK